MYKLLNSETEQLTVFCGNRKNKQSIFVLFYEVFFQNMQNFCFLKSSGLQQTKNIILGLKLGERVTLDGGDWDSYNTFDIIYIYILFLT